MRQGWMGLASCAMVLALGLASPAPAAAAKARATQVAVAETPSKRTMRQFTGYVTALDKATITVEKRGKKPESRVFSKHAEMKTSGAVDKDARVTVFFRDEDGKAVAHRVVAKAATPRKR
jgi:hypothetical protein